MTVSKIWALCDALPLGARSRTGQLDSGPCAAAAFFRLAGEVWPWDRAGGDVCRTRSFSRYPLPSLQLAADRIDTRTDAPGSLYDPFRAGERHLPLSAGAQLSEDPHRCHPLKLPPST